MYIDFESIMSLNRCDTEVKYGNHKCPFCNHFSFKIYPNARAYCHTSTCNWSGDAIQFHADINHITNGQAFKILTKELKNKTIRIKHLTHEEALDDVAEKLQFMALARVYFAFYKDKVHFQSDFRKAIGISKSHFSKIINGDIDNVSSWMFNSVYFFLVRKLPLERLKKDLYDSSYHKSLIKTKGQLDAVKKFMNTLDCSDF